MEEGVVDSSSNRGPVKTLICSSLPMKRTATIPSRLHLQSPTLQIPNTPHIKLYADVEEQVGDLQLEDFIASPVAVAHGPLQIDNLKTNSTIGGRKRKVPSDS